MDATSALMNHPGVSTILATGGNAMVKAAYSCGKPALGVGAGNAPAYIETTADIKQAVNDIAMSKAFDNGMICASEQTVIVDENIYEDVKEEFHVTDTNIVNNIEDTTATPVIEKAVADKIILALQAVDNGIYTMCQDEALEWLVETSSNIASVATDEKEMNIVASQRSNVSSNLKNMANTVRATFQLAGATVTGGDGYPAWKMNPNSLLTKIAVDSYKKLFNKEPKVLGIHAGLECGLFSEKYPNLDMVSFGPTLRYVHTPEERLLIPTVQMVWDHLLDILKNIPE